MPHEDPTTIADKRKRGPSSSESSPKQSSSPILATKKLAVEQPVASPKGRSAPSSPTLTQATKECTIDPHAIAVKRKLQDADLKKNNTEDVENDLQPKKKPLVASPPQHSASPSSPSSPKANSPIAGFAKGGIEQSSLGTFGNSGPDKHSTESSKPLSFGSLSGGSTFGSKALQGVSFGAAAASKVTFDSILTSPVEPSPKPSKKPLQSSEEFNENTNGLHEADKEDEPIQPSVLPPATNLVTGEEEEETIHSGRCKLFVWTKDTWVERGRGNVRLNESTVTSKARLVMRAEGVLRVILNVHVLPGMPCKLRDDKYIEFVACEKPPELTKFLLKVLQQTHCISPLI